MRPFGYRAVLTGASGGLGRAFAAALAPHCSALVLVARDAGRLESLRSTLAAVHSGLTITTIACDLAAASGRRAVVDAVRSLPQPLDLLLNNAGINHFAQFESQTEAVIERLVRVDLLAPMLLTHDLLPLLRLAARAQIVNVGSIFGDIGYPGFTAYSAAKFGLRGFTEALRRELSDSTIAIRYFAPRAVRTPLTTPEISAMNRALGTSEDEPEAVARMLLRFLGSDVCERRIGFPERLYVWVNRILPRLSDRSICTQLTTIRRHLPTVAGKPQPSAKE